MALGSLSSLRRQAGTGGGEGFACRGRVPRWELIPSTGEWSECIPSLGEWEVDGRTAFRRRSAQYRFIRSAIDLRLAAVQGRRVFAGSNASRGVELKLVI